MKPQLSFLAFLLVGACATAPEPSPAPDLAVETVAPSTPVLDPAAEDARLNAFLDAAFDAQAELDPQQLTQLGIKRHYDRLSDFTDAGRERRMALAGQQLDQMRAQFHPEWLSPAGRLSYRLFAEQVERARESFRWRWHVFRRAPTAARWARSRSS